MEIDHAFGIHFRELEQSKVKRFGNATSLETSFYL